MSRKPQTEALPEQTLNAEDAKHLRHAIALSSIGRDRGNRPFGAVIVAPDGEILAEAWASSGETGDCTAHAETSAVRIASQRHSRERLSQSTIYSSAEPCVMCAGAIFWGGIPRVIFGIDAVRLRDFRGNRDDQIDVEMSCREVFDASARPMTCIGPALIEEASQPHVSIWKR